MTILKVHYAAGVRITVCGRIFQTLATPNFVIMPTNKDKKKVTCKVCKINLKNN